MHMRSKLADSPSTTRDPSAAGAGREADAAADGKAGGKADETEGPRFRPLGEAWRDRVGSSLSSEPEAGSAAHPHPSDQPDLEESQMSHDAQTDTGTSSRDGDEDWRAGEPAAGAGAHEFGEEAELRRALDLLDELTELDPDRTSLCRRRAEYARRLGDEDALLDAYLRWAEVLERQASWRSAHLLCQQAVELRPESRRVRKVLERLEAEQGAELGVSLPGGAGWGGAWRQRADEADSGLASVIWPELRRSLEEVNWLQAAALRMLPGESEGPADRDAAEREAAEILGRYFVARQEYERAVEVLTPVVEAASGADEDRLDALYLKGLAHLRMDEEERAGEYFRRVADQDEEFRSVAGWFAPGLEEETTT